jgi:hypothetical protein
MPNGLPPRAGFTPLGVVTFRQAVEHSSNIVMAKISTDRRADDVRDNRALGSEQQALNSWRSRRRAEEADRMVRAYPAVPLVRLKSPRLLQIVMAYASCQQASS